jgi:hypothetical protein
MKYTTRGTASHFIEFNNRSASGAIIPHPERMNSMAREESDGLDEYDPRLDTDSDGSEAAETRSGAQQPTKEEIDRYINRYKMKTMGFEERQKRELRTKIVFKRSRKSSFG